MAEILHLISMALSSCITNLLTYGILTLATKSVLQALHSVLVVAKLPHFLQIITLYGSDSSNNLSFRNLAAPWAIILSLSISPQRNDIPSRLKHPLGVHVVDLTPLGVRKADLTPLGVHVADLTPLGVHYVDLGISS